MLVLARQQDETIMIGDDVEITVVEIRGDKVRLGINAPRDISVHRKEVYDAIRREERNKQPDALPIVAAAKFSEGQEDNVISPKPARKISSKKDRVNLKSNPYDLSEVALKEVIMYYAAMGDIRQVSRYSHVWYKIFSKKKT